MMQINQVIRDAVESISSAEVRRSILGARLRKLKGIRLSQDSGELFEERLSFPVKKAVLNEKIAGVDSGFVDKSLFVVDLVLVRSVGVVFDYKNSIVERAHYHPNFFSFPLPHLTKNALDLDEFACSKSIIRLQQETKTAREVIEKHSPKYCFLDGSIIPQYADKPRKDSRIKEIYHSLIESFENLFETAEKKNCALVACVEDSRASRFGAIISEQVLKGEKIAEASYLEECFDAVLLDYFLDVGERSMLFKYTSATEAHPHPILSDFSERWRNNIFACYLKPAPLDRPLRIEFIHNEEKSLPREAEELASVALALSSMHR